MRKYTRLFFALAYGWSWIFWIPAALSARAFDEPPLPLLIALGGIGPLVAAVALIYTSQDRSVRRDYWQRVVDLRRISAGWYAVIIFTVPVLTALAVLLDILAGGSGAHLEFMINFIGELVVLTERADFFQIGVWAGAALVVVAVWGRESLTRAPEGG